MGVDPQRDARVGMPESGSDHVHRYAGKQQRRGVDMPEIVQPDAWRRRSTLPRRGQTDGPLPSNGS